MEIYGRKIHTNLRTGTPQHLYLPGPHRGVWNLAGLAQSEEVILCESLIDALTFWCAGYRNVTTAYGVEGFTAEHLEALQAHGTKRVLIAYDRDEAGDARRPSSPKTLTGLGHRVLPGALSAGDGRERLRATVTPAAKSLGVAAAQGRVDGAGEAVAETPSNPRSRATDAPSSSDSH